MHDPLSLYAEVAQSLVPTKGLLGRDRERAELAAFCAAEDRSYAWWQADASAGKSALLARFVVDPPSGVQRVSFFITSPQSGQNTSAAFLRDVTVQLEALSGRSQPPLESVHDQVRYLHLLLRACAGLASGRGQRLVLVVDGLDEDDSRSVGLPSIAGILPKRLDHGSKVIVSGRSNPGLPGDVPADHPLRDPAVVRVLSPSEHAIASTDIAAAELQQMLDRGPGLYEDMLGLLVAARGGLEADDFAELAECRLHEIDKALASSAGRTFSPRPIITLRGSQGRAFIFSSEALFTGVATKLRRAHVTEYRERLHRWACDYQDRGWPEETPFYLLRGYREMLTQEHDVPRLVGLAADGARFERMLDVTGSDADGVAEVGAAMDAAVAWRDADLFAVALLACQRDRLADRNKGLPPRLPAAWARAGQPARAAALARSFSGENRARALAWTSISLHDLGQHEAARQLTQLAYDELPLSPVQGGYPTWVAAAVAAALARGGELERAEAMLARIDDAAARGYQLAEVAACMGKAGQSQRAEALAGRADTALHRVRTLAGAAEGLAWAAQSAEATRVAGAAEALARSGDDAGVGDDGALVAAACALALTGHPGRAKALVADVSEPGARGEALAKVAAALATSDSRDLVMDLISTADSLLSEAEAQDRDSWLFSRQRANDDLVQAYAGAGELRAAEGLAHTSGSPDADRLIGIAEKLADCGKTSEAARVLAEAEATARGDTALRSRLDMLIAIARALITVGEAGSATELLSDVEAIAAGQWHDEVPLRHLAEVLAAAGEWRRCAAVIRAISDPQAQENVAAWSARLLAGAGQPSHATDLLVRVNTPKDSRAWADRSVIEALAKGRDFEQAERLATELPDDDSRSRALTSIATQRALAGRLDAALLNKFPGEQARYKAIADIAPALAQAGQPDEALALSDILDEKLRGQAHAGVARALAQAGDVARAIQLTARITNLWWRAAALAWIADAIGASDAAARTDTLADLDELLTAAQRADDEARQRRARQGGLVIWLGSSEQSAAAWAASAAFARAGQAERALHAAGFEPHPKSSRRAAEKVAVTLAEAGYPDAATDLAEKGSFRRSRAEVRARVAVALAHAGHGARARDLLIASFKTGRWESWLSALGEISPPDLLKLADHMRSEIASTLVAWGAR